VRSEGARGAEDLSIDLRQAAERATVLWEKKLGCHIVKGRKTRNLHLGGGSDWGPRRAKERKKRGANLIDVLKPLGDKGGEAS